MNLIYTSNYIRSHVYARVAVEQNAAVCIILMRVYMTLGS